MVAGLLAMGLFLYEEAVVLFTRLLGFSFGFAVFPLVPIVDFTKLNIHNALGVAIAYVKKHPDMYIVSRKY